MCVTEKYYEKGELAKEILKSIALVGFVVAMVAAPGLGRLAPLFLKYNAQSRRRFKQSLKGLEKKKLVRMYVKDGKEVIEITQAGKLKVLEYDLENMKLVIPKKWDGWWRIVMFDIPESKKRARDAVSRKIKELGMYPIQRSAFVSPYLCKNEIDFVGEFFGVRENIIYIKAKEIQGMSKLKKHFNLT